MSYIDDLRLLYPDYYGRMTDFEVAKMMGDRMGVDPGTAAERLGIKRDEPGLISDLDRGVGVLKSSLGQTMTDLGSTEWGPQLIREGENRAFQNPAEHEGFLDMLKNPVSGVRQAVGENAAQLGLTYAGTKTGAAIGAAIGGPAGAVVGGAIGGGIGMAAPMWGNVRQGQLEAGVDNLGTAAVATAGGVALERLGLEKLMMPGGAGKLAREAGEGYWKHVAKNVGKGAVVEGPLTEVPQTGLERWAAEKDLLSGEALEEYGYAGISGAYAGGAIQGAGAGVVGLRTEAPPPPPPPPQLTQQPPETLKVYPDGSVAPVGTPDADVARANAQSVTTDTLTRQQGPEPQGTPRAPLVAEPTLFEAARASFFESLPEAERGNYFTAQGKVRAPVEKMFAALEDKTPAQMRELLEVFQGSKNKNAMLQGRITEHVLNTIDPGIDQQATPEAGIRAATDQGVEPGPTAPEPLADIQAGMIAMAKDAKPAVYISDPTAIMDKVQAMVDVANQRGMDWVIVPRPDGEGGIFVTPRKNKDNLVSLVEQGRDGDALGLGVSNKPGQDANVAVVVARAPDGAAVQAAAVDTANPKAAASAIAAAKNVAQAVGGTVETTTVEEGLKDRQKRLKQEENDGGVRRVASPVHEGGVQPGADAGASVEDTRAGRGGDVQGAPNVHRAGRTDRSGQPTGPVQREVSGSVTSQEAGFVSQKPAGKQEADWVEARYDGQLTIDGEAYTVPEWQDLTPAEQQLWARTGPAGRGRLMHRITLEHVDTSVEGDVTGELSDAAAEWTHERDTGKVKVDGQVLTIPKWGDLTEEEQALWERLPPGRRGKMMRTAAQQRAEGVTKGEVLKAQRAAEREAEAAASPTGEQTWDEIATAAKLTDKQKSDVAAVLGLVDGTPKTLAEVATARGVKETALSGKKGTIANAKEKLRAYLGEGHALVKQIGEAHRKDAGSGSTTVVDPSDARIDEREIAGAGASVGVRDVRPQQNQLYREQDTGKLAVTEPSSLTQTAVGRGVGKGKTATDKWARRVAALQKEGLSEEAAAAQASEELIADLAEQDREGKRRVGLADEKPKKVRKRKVPATARPAAKPAPAAQPAPAPELPVNNDDPVAVLEAQQRTDKIRPLLPEPAQKTLDRFVKRYAEGDIDLERLTAELDALEARAAPGATADPLASPETKASHLMRKPEEGTTEKAIREVLAEFLGSDALWGARPHWRIHIYRDKTKGSDPDATLMKVGASLRGANVSAGHQAWVERDKNGIWHAYFVPSMITPGTERAVFLHEVGVHLGLGRLLNPAQFQRLADKVNEWANLDTAITETDIAQRAIRRLEKEREVTNLGAEQANEQLVAYFVEEAVNGGIDPSVDQVNPELTSWFRQLWAIFKSALRKIRLQNIDRLHATDLVDLAYGAARMELHGAWHGTGAKYRQFDHSFLFTGEGFNAYGMGSYLAQRFGIAKTYWRNDVESRDADNAAAFSPAKQRELLIDGKDFKDEFEYTDAQKGVPALAVKALSQAVRRTESNLEETLDDARQWLNHEIESTLDVEEYVLDAYGDFGEIDAALEDSDIYADTTEEAMENLASRDREEYQDALKWIDDNAHRFSGRVRPRAAEVGLTHLTNKPLKLTDQDFFTIPEGVEVRMSPKAEVIHHVGEVWVDVYYPDETGRNVIRQVGLASILDSRGKFPALTRIERIAVGAKVDAMYGRKPPPEGMVKFVDFDGYANEFIGWDYSISSAGQKVSTALDQFFANEPIENLWGLLENLRTGRERGGRAISFQRATMKEADQLDDFLSTYEVGEERDNKLRYELPLLVRRVLGMEFYVSMENVYEDAWVRENATDEFGRRRIAHTNEGTKELNRKLRALGIKGNKHIDAPTRQARREGRPHDTTMNFIVYDDRDIFSPVSFVKADPKRPMFSTAEGPTKGTTREAVESIVNELTGERKNWRVHTYNTAEAVAAGLRGELKDTDQAWVEVDENGLYHAHFILDRIAPGTERGVFFHEVGVHIGMGENMRGAINASYVSINQWAQSGTPGSIEHTLAVRAIDRAIMNIPIDISADDYRNEVVAYFVEEAVNAGIDPRDSYKGPIGQFMRKFWKVFRRAYETLLGTNVETTPQDIVDTAYGLAHIALTEDHTAVYPTSQASVEHVLDQLNTKLFTEHEKHNTHARRFFLKSILGEVLPYIDTIDVVSPPEEEGVDGRTSGGQYSTGTSTITIFDDVPPETGNRFRHVLAHEVAHAIEVMITGGLGKFPELRVVADERGLPTSFVGWAAQAVNRLFRTGHPDVRNTLAYPIVVPYHQYDPDTTDTGGWRWAQGRIIGNNKRQNAERVSAEMFAQLVALKEAWTERDLPNGRRHEFNIAWADVRRKEPKLADWLEAKINEAIQKTREETGAELRPQFQRQPAPGGPKGPNKPRRASGLRGSNSPRQGPVNQPAGALERAGRTLDSWLTNPKGAGRRLALAGRTLEQLGVKAKRVFGSDVVGKYISTAHNMQRDAGQIVADAAKIDHRWMRLHKRQAERLSKTMRMATRHRFDPEKDVATEPEHREINALWAGLNGEAKQVYRDVRDFYNDMFEQRVKIMEDASEGSGSGAAKALRRKLAKHKGPYFPLMRLGDFYSVGKSSELAALDKKFDAGAATDAEKKRRLELRKDPAHYKTSGHRTEREAKASMEEMRAAGLSESYYSSKEVMAGENMPRFNDVDRISEYLTAGLNKREADRINGMLTKMYFDMYPDNPAIKQLLKREGVYGEHEDMREVFGESARSIAHHVSRLRHAREMNSSLLEIRNAVREGHQGGNTQERSEIYNELIERTNLNLDRENVPALINDLLKVSYFANLGLSPAYMLTNMSQVPMITVPWLMGRHSFDNTWGALQQAYGDAVGIITDSYERGGDTIADRALAEVDWGGRFDESTPEHRLFTELLRRNKLDITMEHDLGVVLKGMSEKADRATKLANAPIRGTEVANRLVTALAAYRLEYARTRNEQAAINYAVDAVSETQLDYSALNAPRIMREFAGSKTAARMMMQFRKYQQGMIWLLAHSAKMAVAGKDKAEQVEARKRLAGLFGMQALFAGALGIPLIFPIAFVYEVLGSWFGDDDEPYDFETDFKNWVTDMSDAKTAELLTKGVLSLAEIDVTQRIGMGDIFNPLPFARQGKTGYDTTANVLAAAAGAPVGSIAHAVDGLVMMGQGDVEKGAEKLIPLKLAQNLIRANRYRTEGLTTRKGDVVRDDFTGWDLVMRAAGFSTQKEKRYYEGNAAMVRQEQAVESARGKLIREYLEATQAGDAQGKKDVLERIKAFNKRHPKKGVAITRSTLLRSVQARARNTREETGLRSDRASRLYRDAARFVPTP